MAMRDLPDMYARSPRTAGLRAEGIRIRQIMNGHVTSIISLCSHGNNTSSFNLISNCHTRLQGYKYKLLMPYIVNELSAYIHLIYSGNTLYMKP